MARGGTITPRMLAVLVADKLSVTKKDAKAFADGFVAEMVKAVVAGKSVLLPGLARFETRGTEGYRAFQPLYQTEVRGPPKTGDQSQDPHQTGAYSDVGAPLERRKAR